MITGQTELDKLIREYEALQERVRITVARNMSADELHVELMILTQEVGDFLERYMEAEAKQ